MSDRHSIETSPIHRAVWTGRVSRRAFESRPLQPTDAVHGAIDGSLAAAERHRERGTLYGPDGMVSEQAISDLATQGYWAVPAAREHGGLGGSFAETAMLVARMSEVDPYVAGLLSLQACLGPIKMLEAFGTPEQKRRLIPPLARGERLGAFAITEPISSSDWSMLQCVARRDGDSLLLTGEKFLITNAAPGRTVSLLCKLDGRLEMLAVELPREQSASFQVVRPAIKAPLHVVNAGLRFDGLRVPAENVIRAPHGDGRVPAYFSLNRGRVAICGFATGMMRRMAAELIRWAGARTTFGGLIGGRELVEQRLGRLATGIVASDALLAWSAQLLDEGAHGELECVTAKVFASETLREALTVILLKTLGGRSFLEGSLFADFVFDALLQAVYEGENELVTLGSFHSLARQHGRQLAAMARAFGALRAHRSLATAARAGALAARYALSSAGQRARIRPRGASPEAQALRALEDVAVDIRAAFRRHGEKIMHRQALGLELAQRAQLATTILVVSRYGDRQADELVRAAALAAASELCDRLAGRRPSETTRARLIELGAEVAQGGFPLVSPATLARAAAPRMLEHLERSPIVDEEAARRAGTPATPSSPAPG